MSSQPKPLKQLVILSGKGGTRKTSLTGALVHLAAKSSTKCVLVDADVDAANLALVTGASHKEEYKFNSSKEAKIGSERCSLRNKCYKVCRYDAIDPSNNEYVMYEVIDLLC